MRNRISPIFLSSNFDSIPAVSKFKLNASPSGKYQNMSRIQSVGIRSKLEIDIMAFVTIMAAGGNFSCSYIGM